MPAYRCWMERAIAYRLTPTRAAFRAIAHIGALSTEESPCVYRPSASPRGGFRQQAPHRRNQLGGVRLDEIGVRPGEHARLDVGRGGVAGEDDDGRACVRGANLFTQGQPVDVPQPAVEDVETEPLALHQPEGGLHIRRDDGLEVRQTQLSLEHVTGVRVVFDAEDTIGLHRWNPFWTCEAVDRLEVLGRTIFYARGIVCAPEHLRGKLGNNEGKALSRSLS